MARILLIDDEASVRATFRTVLRRAGHQVEEAFDGAAGIRCFHRHPADLVVTDLFMPGQNGLDVIREIRRVDPRARIISITAGLGDDCARARELGALRTFVKPVKLQEFLEAVEEVLKEKPKLDPPAEGRPWRTSWS